MEIAIPDSIKHETEVYNGINSMIGQLISSINMLVDQEGYEKIEVVETQPTADGLVTVKQIVVRHNGKDVLMVRFS